MNTDKLRFFLLVKTKREKVANIREELLKQISELTVVHCPLGPTDFICYGIAKNLADVQRIAHEVSILEIRGTHPIAHTEAIVSVEMYGKELTREHHNNPTKVAAWVLASVSDFSAPELCT
jgi:hypothetical protein